MSSVAVFSKASPFDALQRWLPKLVLAPSMFIVLVGFYGYILWTFVLSFTTSTFLPTYKWAALRNTPGCSTTTAGGWRARTWRCSAACSSASPW
jgi:ABC-type sugar transport system permease subunit